MTTIKETILYELQYGPKSTQQLIDVIHTSPSSITGRIAELRNQGYYIANINGKYILQQQKKKQSIEEMIIDYIEQNKLFGKVLSITTLSSSLHIPLDNIKSAIAHLFSHYTITQISSDTIKIEKHK